jgi:hypothetical protein
MPAMFDIIKTCELQKCHQKKIHKNMETSTNNPNMTKAMQYSQYLRTATPRTHYVTSATAGLASEGITFVSLYKPILVSLRFTNLKEFNMPRLKTFSRINVK